jgi:hypothetical protein
VSNGCLGCQRCEDGPTVVLVDGRTVCTYCPDWRDECLAREILKMPKERRRAWLFGVVENGRVVEKGLEQIHGKEKADHMAGLVRAVWDADRQAAASTASAAGWSC